jgi:hypothetical protein
LTGKKHSGSDLGQALLLEGGWGVQMKGVCVCVCVCVYEDSWAQGISLLLRWPWWLENRGICYKTQQYKPCPPGARVQRCKLVVLTRREMTTEGPRKGAGSWRPSMETIRSQDLMSTALQHGPSER